MQTFKLLAVFLLLSGDVFAQGSYPSPIFKNSDATKYYAPAFGSCVWDATHDVGPCINLAIAAAATAKGGEIVLPGGFYGLSTAIIQTTSGVGLRGQGVGSLRDNLVPQNLAKSVTNLKWLGAAGATMLTVQPATLLVPSLNSANVTGIAFDANGLANYAVVLNQVSNSKFEINAAQARLVNILVTTSLTADSPGTQNNDFWLSSIENNPSYSPTGILIDGGAGSNWNVSYNRFWRLNAWYAKGDGIVFGNSDNNLIFDLGTYQTGGATGSPVIFATTGYVMPNGQSVTSQAYNARVMHVGSQISVQGYTAGTRIVPAGGNAGNLSFAPVSTTTTDTTAYGQGLLTVASSAGVAVGMSAQCGNQASGIVNDNVVNAVGAGTVKVSYAAISAVPIGAACTFGAGAKGAALVGVYTLTAAGPATYALAGPGGQHGQTGIAASGGVLSFNDFVFPVSGTPATGDTWTVTVSQPPVSITLEDIDKANSIPSPHFAIGAVGTFQNSNGLFPTQSSVAQGINLGFSPEQCGGLASFAGPQAVSLGNCGGVGAGGTFSATLGGVGNNAPAYGAATVGGHNNGAGGIYSIVFGEGNTSGGGGSLVAGEYATDRGDAALVWGAGDFTSGPTQGAAQTRRAVLVRSLTSTAATALTTSGTAPSATNSLRIPVNTAAKVSLLGVVCTETTTRTNWATWNRIEGALVRGAGSPTYAGAASTATTPSLSGGTGSTSSVTVSADTTNNVLAVAVTWPNSSATHCVAELELIEVQ
jgi:hypothetical protein